MNNQKSWKKKRVKLQKTIDFLNSKLTVKELWEIYIERYFVVMELGQFCKLLRKGKIRL